MAMKKNTGAPVAEAPITETPAVVVTNATDAAVDRLTTLKAAIAAPVVKKQYKDRDFDAEARGKTRCVQFEAALMSPAIAGMKFKSFPEYLALVREAAEAGVAYTFGEDKK